ncbi:MAG: GIY-YIG nuclease family protein [Candidatus Kryptoniota bacterium]
MAREKTYYVYITASYSRVIYVGMTNDLCRRMYEHRHKLTDGFTKRYNADKLVYYEATNDVRLAIEREKQIKKWRREKKIVLIESENAGWRDLYEELCGKDQP